MIDYRKIRRIAIAHAKGYGNEDPEDFAQECCLYAFEKQTENIFIQHRYTDYLRGMYGRRDTPSGELRRAIAKASGAFSGGGGEEAFVDDGSAKKALAKLSRFERLIYVLHHKYEVPLVCVADALEISGGRVTQMLAAIQKKL